MKRVDKERNLVLIIQTTQNTKEKERAFSQLFKNYKTQILSTVRTKLGFYCKDAEDLTMEVFEKLNSKIETYDLDKGAVSTWIFKIVNNKIIDHSRRRKYETVSVEGMVAGNSDEKDYEFQIEDKSNSGNGLNEIVRNERFDALRKAISTIKNEERRKIIELFYFKQKTHEEICKEMNINIQTVKNLLHRTKLELRDKLEQIEFEY